MPPAAQPDLADLREPKPDETVDLLELLYLVPIGVIQFGPDGAVELINAKASQLLLPLLSEPSLDNLFDALRELVPELREQVGSFRSERGTILDQRHIKGVTAKRPVVLSLTVTRVRRSTFVAVLRDVTRLTEMMAYAFASADLLLDMDDGGRIGWTAGSVQALLGMAPDALLGRTLESLLLLSERPRFAAALLAGATAGRLRPLALRLGVGAKPQVVVAGIALDGIRQRFLVTIGPMPSLGDPGAAVPIPAAEFRALAERALRDCDRTVMGLVEVKGWRDAASSLDPDRMAQLRRDIGSVGQAEGADVLVGDLGPGRFGLLGEAATSVDRIGRSLEAVVRSAANRPVEVRSDTVALASDEGSVDASLQALRLLLARFGAGGQASSFDLGKGLAGVLARARQGRREAQELIAENRFRLAFQPIVALADRSVHHYEALIRPSGPPDRPPPRPDEFVAMIESVGLACELDRAVIAKAADACAASGVAVAVNVSALSLADPEILAQLEAGARRLPPQHLLVELTETAEIPDMESMARALERLRGAGLLVCLDDFGAGHASFRTLRGLRFDIVKIDGAYVRQARSSAQDLAVVRAMRDIAAASGAVTVAEMVETEEDAALMQSLGVEFGQGWLFGRPGDLPLAHPTPLQLRKPGDADGPKGEGVLRRWRY